MYFCILERVVFSIICSKSMLIPSQSKDMQMSAPISIEMRANFHIQLFDNLFLTLLINISFQGITVELLN